MAAPVVQLRIPEDTLAALDGAHGGDTRSAWILALIERELLDDGNERCTAVISPTSPATSPLGAIGPGKPSPGVVCMTPACWERSTRKYGLRRLPLCDACCAALEGRTYGRRGRPAPPAYRRP